jgi:Tfp pilus assembly protein PilO
MFKFLIPTILLVISVIGFLTFTNPLYQNISTLRAQVTSYNEALDNSKALENERDKLTNKYNSIDPNNLTKLQKLLPDNVDNIRLILEIEKVATPYGMDLADVQYNATAADTTTQAGGTLQPAGTTQSANNDYGTWTLQFSTQGTYDNFINFIKDLEKNLRIVDISSIAFSSAPTAATNSSFVQSYKYTFTIKTYWLKN